MRGPSATMSRSAPVACARDATPASLSTGSEGTCRGTDRLPGSAQVLRPAILLLNARPSPASRMANAQPARRLPATPKPGPARKSGPASAASPHDTATLPRMPLRICFIASEVAPLAKTGGLADVAGALTKYLHAAGHDVRTVHAAVPAGRSAARSTIWPVEFLRDITAAARAPQRCTFTTCTRRGCRVRAR